MKPANLRVAACVLALLAGAALPPNPAADERGMARINDATERRVALVIGNSGYRHAQRLDNADNDAQLIAKTLQNLGFALVGGKALLDLDKSAMDQAVQAFGSDLRPDSVALFYYAGHGNQIGNANYLLPVDANPFKPSDFDFQTLEATKVLKQMQDAGTRLNIVILDACRTNPFGGRGLLRAGEAGLAQMEPPAGTLIAYAAGVGKAAQDGPAGGNSPYTRALAQAMRQSGLTLWETFNAVGLEVKQGTDGVQTPWISNEPIQGSFCFAGCAAGGESATERQLRERIRQLEAAQTVPPAPPVVPVVKPPPQPQPSKPDFGIVMLRLSGGTLQMGCGPNEAGCDNDEKPRHAVRVPAFALGKTEVTQGQWKAVMGSNPSNFKNCGDNCPVENVSWNDVQTFIAKLNAQTADGYRLPSEAEWEYAARAGTTTAFSTGDCISTTQANYDGTSDYNGCGAKTGVYLEKTQPVGSYPANPWGLHDMHGNVREWVQDCWHDSYQGVPTDGSAWDGGADCADSRRVLRGGSWYGYPRYLRSANRDRIDTGDRDYYVGFRLARTLTP
ncbi:MAG: SUMF1/EgtB/PvdO family nonheme iron enzyme [Candidatus Methylumidiphilus sp.]